MATLPQVSAAVQAMRVTTAQAADTALHDTKRPDTAKLTGLVLTQALVLGWLAHPDATVEQLAQRAARIGVDASPQASDQRFTPATATLLQTVLQHSVQHVIAADPSPSRCSSVSPACMSLLARPSRCPTRWPTMPRAVAGAPPTARARR